LTTNSMILYDNIIQVVNPPSLKLRRMTVYKLKYWSVKGRCGSRMPQVYDPAICFFTTRGGRQATKFILSSRAPTFGRGEGSDLKSISVACLASFEVMRQGHSNPRGGADRV
jgi:hypothetical protein